MLRYNRHVSPGRCGAFARSTGKLCRNRVMPGRKRCRLHGGLSTGPKAPEGKRRVAEAMAEGRRRWIEKMRTAKLAGKINRFPCGRKRGGTRKRLQVEESSIPELLAIAHRGAQARLSVLNGKPLTERRQTLIDAGKRAVQRLEDRLSGLDAHPGVSSMD